MITFVSFFWNTGIGPFLPQHVNILANALRFHADFPHRFVCITDERGAFAPHIEVMPLPDAARSFMQLPAPQGGVYPSCYRRLWLLSDEARVLGDKVMQCDLDVVWLKNPRPLVETDGDFVAYNPKYPWGRGPLLNGSLWMLRTGTHGWLWDKFMSEPQEVIDHARNEGWLGSDQAILSCYLHDKCSMWDNEELGIYAPEEAREWDIPPADVRIAMFNGRIKPWTLNKPWTDAYCEMFKA